uniref:Uncharacterized protein n=1 Tax=Panagrolaimus sp. PS1159 TaxID=55785 RepID=A0AC35G7Q6_9BILA
MASQNKLTKPETMPRKAYQASPLHDSLSGSAISGSNDENVDEKNEQKSYISNVETWSSKTSSNDDTIKDFCVGRLRKAKPFDRSFLDENCFDELVTIALNGIPLDTSALEKFKNDSIDELPISEKLKRNFYQITLQQGKLTPIQRHLISMIVEDKRNLQINYPKLCGAKTALLIGIIEKVERIKKEMTERKKGPIAIILIENDVSERREVRKHLLLKLRQLLSGTSVTYSINNPAVAKDIAILPINTFLESSNIKLSNLALFCIFNAEILLKQTKKEMFLDYIDNFIGNDVQRIVAMNRMAGDQRAWFYDICKHGSLRIYNPSKHDA